MCRTDQGEMTVETVEGTSLEVVQIHPILSSQWSCSMRHLIFCSSDQCLQGRLRGQVADPVVSGRRFMDGLFDQHPCFGHGPALPVGDVAVRVGCRFPGTWISLQWCFRSCFSSMAPRRLVQCLEPGSQSQRFEGQRRVGSWGSCGRPLVPVYSAVSGVAVARCEVVDNFTATT